MAIPLSDLENLCENWAAWCGTELVRLGYPPPPLFKFYLPRGDARDPGWGDEESTPGPPEPVIQVLKAELLDGVLLQLRTAHWHRIRRKFLHRHHVAQDKLHEAMRALGDRIEARPKLREQLL